jgi:hypothetical protein
MRVSKPASLCWLVRGRVGYLLYTRLLTLMCGPDTFLFEMTVASLKN